MATSVMPATEFSTLFETQKVEAKFLVPSDGDYYLGFHLLSDALMHIRIISAVRRHSNG